MILHSCSHCVATVSGRVDGASEEPDIVEGRPMEGRRGNRGSRGGGGQSSAPRDIAGAGDRCDAVHALIDARMWALQFAFVYQSRHDFAFSAGCVSNLCVHIDAVVVDCLC